MESDTAPTIGETFPSRSPRELRKSLFDDTRCQIWAVLYNLLRVPGAGTGAAKVVAGMRASRRVEKRMVIGACDKGVKRLVNYAHSVSKLSRKRNLVDEYTYFEVKKQLDSPTRGK